MLITLYDRSQSGPLRTYRRSIPKVRNETDLSRIVGKENRHGTPGLVYYKKKEYKEFSVNVLL